MTLRVLTAAIEVFPLKRVFSISRGSKTEAVVVRVQIAQGDVIGQGECVPYPRYGETPASSLEQVLSVASHVDAGATRQELLKLLPACAARNAIDCALWDLEAKLAGKTVAELIGHSVPDFVTTAYTISLDSPENMAMAAREAAHYPLLKLKLGAEEDELRLRAVRAAVPNARLVVDANEGWVGERLDALVTLCVALGVELVEQPLPQSDDSALVAQSYPITICADESVHASAGFVEIEHRYDAINIKLDKTGGLTEALVLADLAKKSGKKIMVGCMVGSSLSMVPAMMLAGFADWVDLDGPLLLAQDREFGLSIIDGVIDTQSQSLWGR